MKFVNKNKLILTETSVSDLFITEYMPRLNTNSIKIYLYLLYTMKMNQELSESDLKRNLLLTDTQLYDSLKELEKYKLLVKDDKVYIVKNVIELELENKYMLKADVKDIYIPKYDEKRIQAVQAINQMFFNGTMSEFWYTDIEQLFEKYNFDEDVMVALFSTCNENNAMSEKYMQKVASTWASAGVKDLNTLNEYMTLFKEINSLESKIKNNLRMKRSLSAQELELLKKWYKDYKYDYSVIEYAFSKTIGRDNPILYANKVIENWKQLNFITLDDVKKHEMTRENNTQDNNPTDLSVTIKAKSKKTLKKEEFKDYEQRTYYDMTDFYS